MNSSKVHFPQPLLSVVKFILPFFLWMFLFRDFIFGRIPVNMDTNTIYSVTKFYFNNLLNGTVPLWDPFVLLGTPFYAITICNLFNPVTQLVPILKLCGLNYYDAFMVYATVYYFLGTIGFYCLAKTIFSDRRAAYIAYLLLLFSGIGVSIFNQMTILELFVPAVWFFVFLLRFTRHYRASDFLGLSLSVMIVMISYLPFYFATLFLCFFVLGAFLFFKESISTGRNLLVFARKHFTLITVCCIGWMISCAPLAVYKMIDGSEDVVSPARHCNYAQPQDCYERTLNEEGGMSYKETSQSGGLAERVHWRGLFAHLDKASYGVDQFFYVPVAAFLFILLSVFVALDRGMILLAALGTILTLIGMGPASGVHRFFYDHLFFFKYFRNLFFFEAYIIPIIILFAVGQLRRLWSVSVHNFSVKKAMIFWTVAVHAGVFVFLIKQEGMIPTSLLSVAASLILFLAFYCGLIRKMSAVLIGGIIVLTALQPFEVFYHYAKNAGEFQCALPKDHVRPQFSWTRPTQELKSSCKIFKFVPYESFYNSMAMTDSRGAIGYPASVTRGAFLLSQWIEEKNIVARTHYKLALYDQERSGYDQPLEIRELAKDWTDHPPEFLSGPSAAVQVWNFNVNNLTLRLDLPSRKFLVYADALTKYWKVYVNDRPQQLKRADVAFKGVWVPAGKSIVEFRYAPPGGGAVYIIVTFALMVFGGMAIVYFRRENNWPWTEKAS